MEVAVPSGNSQRLVKLMDDTVGRRTSVSGTVCVRNGEPVFADRKGLTVGLNASKSSLASLTLL